MSNWIETRTREELDEAIARYIASALAADISAHGDASLAISGGSTPKGFFRKLSEHEIDWSRVIITLVDCPVCGGPHHRKRTTRIRGIVRPFTQSRVV